MKNIKFCINPKIVEEIRIGKIDTLLLSDIGTTYCLPIAFLVIFDGLNSNPISLLDLSEKIDMKLDRLYEICLQLEEAKILIREV